MGRPVGRTEDCLGDPRLCLCGHLRRAARAVTQVYDEAFQPTGLKATQVSLLQAAWRQGPSTLNRLAGAVVMDRTTLARNLKPLARLGLVRISQGADRRSREVTVTFSGRKALLKAYPEWRRAQARMRRRIGGRGFDRLLASLTAAVEAARAPARGDGGGRGLP